VSVPAPGSGGKGGKKGGQSQTHKRRSSSGVTAGQTGGSGAPSGAGASGAANAQSFVIGTNTLGTRNRRVSLLKQGFMLNRSFSQLDVTRASTK
jgi:hypothetical protein